MLHSVLEHYRNTNVSLVIQNFDISRYFDRHTLLEAMEWLEDSFCLQKVLQAHMEDELGHKGEGEDGSRHDSDGIHRGKLGTGKFLPGNDLLNVTL